MIAEGKLPNGIHTYVLLMDSKTDMYLPYDSLRDLNKFLEYHDYQASLVLSGILTIAITPNVLR
jgi:hypothetical protein